ncbi:Hypothetical protein BN117_0524 [Bordetella parapertussis Bpp5]|uniref:Uncharacterized protein n=1 Tax=Bordetella parapertussis (strain Bpp5) TaxID=1208660 RepID=K0MDM3_BORPB|nr:Hypothetical protein BN117_0524 [Bordetella parapertussis Bpp5]
MVAGAFLRRGIGGVLGEAVDKVELADEGRQLLVFSGGIAGRCGRCAGQRDDQRQGQGRHSAARGRRVAKGCHHAVPQSSGWRDAAAWGRGVPQRIGTGGAPDLPRWLA